MQVVRPHNLDEYFLNLLKNIYKSRNLSVEVGVVAMNFNPKIILI